jgi:hypothetical protein
MGVASAIERWRNDRAAARAYEKLGVEEREALARDLGLSEERLGRVVARGSRAGEELTRLLDAVDLDMGDIGRHDPDLLRDLQVTCSTCSVVKGCRRDLDAGVGHLVYQSYCPNAETVAELADAARPAGPRAT